MTCQANIRGESHRAACFSVCLSPSVCIFSFFKQRDRCLPTIFTSHISAGFYPNSIRLQAGLRQTQAVISYDINHPHRQLTADAFHTLVSSFTCLYCLHRHHSVCSYCLNVVILISHFGSDDRFTHTALYIFALFMSFIDVQIFLFSLAA